MKTFKITDWESRSTFKPSSKKDDLRRFTTDVDGAELLDDGNKFMTDEIERESEIVEMKRPRA